MTKNRNSLTDLLKGIAVIYMILVHIVEKFGTTTIQQSTTGKLLLFLGGPPVAPVFMIIMGYFIAVSKKTTSQLIVRGVKIFLLGMLLNVAINTNLFISINKGIFILDPLPYLFGVDILHLAGLSTIIIAILKNSLKNNPYLPFVLIAISGLASKYLQQYIPENNFLKYITAFIYGNAQWSYFPMFPWLAYPLTGFILYQLQPKLNIQLLINNNLVIPLMVGVFIFCFFTFNYSINIASDLPKYYHHDLLFVCWLLIFMLGYGLAMFTINEKFKESNLCKATKWIGQNVTIIYIVQWIIIGNKTTEIYQTIKSPFKLTYYFMMIFLCSIALTYLFLKIKENHKVLQKNI